MSASEPSDAALVKAAVGGSQPAFGTLMRRHKDRLYRIVLRNVGNPEAAQDVLQESFASAWRALARYDAARPFEHWLTRIALNKCRDHARRLAVRRLIGGSSDTAAAERVADLAPAADVALADRQELRRLDVAIAALPTKLREALVLTAIDGMAQSEAAAVLGVSAKAIETRVYRARVKLAAALSRGYQPELGAPWFLVEHHPIYLPGKLFWWWYWYDAYAPGVFARGGLIAASGGLAAILIAIVMSVVRAREARDATTFGSARWATANEVRGAGLLGDTGVVLGRYERDYLRHDGPEHVLCFAPTRSGKGVGLVVPTLLTWPGSAIVHDIKGENWTLTASWRARFGRVLRFDPTQASSDAYNPLLEVRRGAFEVRDVQNIADILVDPEGALEKRNHWEKTSHALLVGAILHVLYAENDKTLAGVAAFLSDPARPIEATLTAMMATRHLGDRPHPVVASAARELLNKSDNERSGVLSTAMSFLGLYRDPVVAAVTRRCDWRIAEVVEGALPVTLYLVVPPSDISRTKPLVRLILNQIGRRLTEELDGRRRRHRLLLMLDEFPALGRLDFFESALAFMAGYGLKAFLIAQSLNQIEKAYGQNNAILDNCHVRVSFATNDERTAKRVSDALGTATEIRDARNYAGHRLSPWLGHLMVSRQESARPLLTPGEVMQLPPADALVLVSGVHPIRAKKARYYEDRRLSARVLAPPVPREPRATTLRPGRVPLPTEPTDPPDCGGDAANGGIRREPELPTHDDIAPPSPEASEPPIDIDDDAPVAAALQARRLRATARQAAMDPDDGIAL